jgi:hypothetical protein
MGFSPFWTSQCSLAQASDPSPDYHCVCLELCPTMRVWRGRESLRLHWLTGTHGASTLNAGGHWTHGPWFDGLVSVGPTVGL